MDKTLSGKKAGLSSAKDMKIEAEKLKQKESEAFKIYLYNIFFRK
jgi:hypothetical protein